MVPGEANVARKTCARDRQEYFQGYLARCLLVLINYLSFSDRTGIRMHQDDKRLTSPIIFIGPGRSGSTIISEVIFAHETLAWPSNHLEYLPRVPLVNLLRPVFDNPYWSLIGEMGQLNKTRLLNSLLPLPAEAFPFWESLTRPEIDFSRGFLLDQVANEEEQRRIRSTIARLVSWQGKQRFAMKLTGPGRIGYLQSIFPDARFVNVIRDPVATVRSLLAVPFWKDLGMHRLWWTGAYSNAELNKFEAIRDDPVAATAFQLAKVLKTTQQEALRCGANLLTVHYEQFVENPSQAVQQICAFLDLSVSDNLQRKLAQTTVHDRNRQKSVHDHNNAGTVLKIIGESGL
jgi:hypothetical protein